MIFKENEVKTTEIEKRAEGGVIGTESFSTVFGGPRTE